MMLGKTRQTVSALIFRKRKPERRLRIAIPNPIANSIVFLPAEQNTRGRLVSGGGGGGVGTSCTRIDQGHSLTDWLRGGGGGRE